MTSFSWLHLTDLHLGMADQLPLLPAIKDRFFEDLKTLHETCGPWDLVLFTGDLAQKGSAEEFQKVDEFLDLLWARLRALGSEPKLLAVPGNHDLARPNPKEPEVKLLRNWEADRDVQSEFWTEEKSPYRKRVGTAFENYAAWWDKVKLKPPVQTGMLSGDFAATVTKREAKLGVVGLNTTFLQLTDGDYKGKLAVDARQFQAACEGDGPAWVKKHNVCLLLTHQPPDWLTADAQEHFKAEIAGYGFFAVHLFGHMHEARYRSGAQGGAAVIRPSQGTSLFGLEYFGEQQKLERRHGYAAGKIELLEDKASFTLWPRQAFRPGGQWNFAADNVDFKLKDEHISPEEFALLNPYTEPVAVPDAVSAKPPAGPATGRPFPNQWAVLIGVNDYQYITKLRYCRNDVIELAGELRQSLRFQGDRVFEIHEQSELKPDRDVIFRKLADLRDSGKMTPEDLFVFYFSGHGLNVDDKDYLLPIQASPRDVKRLGIKVDDLVDALQETKCNYIAMFIDACRETVEGAKGTASIGEDSKTTVSKAGIVTFFSCDPKDRSYEIEALKHGSFTYCILDAIRKGAATTVQELDDYLRENVPQINTDNGKPPQQPYAVIQPPERGELSILFNPLRFRQEAEKYSPLIIRLAELNAAGKISSDESVRVLEFLDQVKMKKQLDEKDKTKLSLIEALSAGRLTPATAFQFWDTVEARRAAAPQIKRLPRLGRS